MANTNKADAGGTIPVAELTTSHEFCAAHRLRSPHLSPAENRALFGPCAREHGHTYRLEVAIRGPVDQRTGMVMDLFVLRNIVEQRVVSRLDHRNLDRDVPLLEGQLSTLENLSRVIWRQLQPAIAAPDGPRLHRVTLAESSLARVSLTADG